MHQQVALQGITKTDIQQIFEEEIRKHRSLPRIMYLDCSYLYTFKLEDVYYVRKFTDMIRESEIVVIENGREVVRNPKAIEWHGFLEKWNAGETVDIWGQPVKPIAITRTFDRVPNEALEQIAGGFTASTDFAPMKFHALGSGAVAGTSPSPNATALVTEVDRIDVTEEPGGGSMTRDGSTIFVVGNHDVFMESSSLTETGIFDSDNVLFDRMGDYSIYPAIIPHTSGQDSPGASTIIYQCSS